MLFPILLLGSTADQRPAFLQSIQRLNTVSVTQWIPRSLRVTADGSTIGALTFDSAPFSAVPWTTTPGTTDIVVAKWDSAGNMQWHTYLVPTDTTVATNSLTSLVVDDTGVYLTLTIRRPLWLQGTTTNYTITSTGTDSLGIAKLDIATGLALWASSQSAQNIREGVFAWSATPSLVLVARKSGIVQYAVDATTGILDVANVANVYNTQTSRLMGAAIDPTNNQLIAVYTALTNGAMYVVSTQVGSFAQGSPKLLLSASTWGSFSITLSSPTTVAFAVTAMTNQTLYPLTTTSTNYGQNVIVSGTGTTWSALVFVLDRTTWEYVDVRRYPRGNSGSSVSAMAVGTAADGTFWLAGEYSFTSPAGGVLDLGGVSIAESDNMTYSFAAQLTPLATTCQAPKGNPTCFFSPQYGDNCVIAISGCGVGYTVVSLPAYCPSGTFLPGTWTCDNTQLKSDVVSVETFQARLYALSFKGANSRVLGLTTSPLTKNPPQFGQFTYTSDAAPLERPYLAATYTACNASSFQQVAPTASADRTCALLTVCGSGYYELAAPTPTTDRQCRMISQCAAGTFLTTPATSTADNICSPWKTCGVGFTVYRAGTNLTDVTCAAATCLDGIKNAAETDIDCGGTQCPGCKVGQRCSVTSDCAAGSCSGGTCFTNSCYDGILNNEETDLVSGTGCGGTVCMGCPFGYRCNTDKDCAANYWCRPVNGINRCIPPCTHTALVALGDGIAGTNGACSTLTPAALPTLPSSWFKTDVVTAYTNSSNSPNCQAACKDALGNALNVCNRVLHGSGVSTSISNQGIEGFAIALQTAQQKCGGTITPPGDKTPNELIKTLPPTSGAATVVLGAAVLLGLLAL